MGQENMANGIQVTEFKVTYAGSRVDQNIVVDEHSRGSRPGAYAPAAS